MNNIFDISEHSKLLVEELLKDGWDVMIHHSNTPDETCCKDEPRGPTWEVDFTRKKPDGGWDNHESGCSTDINEAVKLAYQHILLGHRLKTNKE